MAFAIESIVFVSAGIAALIVTGIFQPENGGVIVYQTETLLCCLGKTRTASTLKLPW